MMIIYFFDLNSIFLRHIAASPPFLMSFSASLQQGVDLSAWRIDAVHVCFACPSGILEEEMMTVLRVFSRKLIKRLVFYHIYYIILSSIG